MALILQLDASGQPNKWITWKAAVTYHAKNLVAWEIGEVETVVKGGTSSKTGSQTVVVTSSIMAVKGNAKRKYRVPALDNPALFRRDHHLCAYCGDKFHEDDLTRDHIIPQAHNGEDTWMNCVSACIRCNQRKDDRTPEQARMPLLFAPYIPNKAEHLILKNRNILADQMEFLLSFVDEKSSVRRHAAKR